MSSRIATLPNLLTMLRMVLIPVFVSLLFYQRFYWALAVFVLAGVTDGLDGLLARRFNQKSQLGSILDPIADKLLLVTSFIVLALPSISPQQQPPSHLPVPFWVTTAVISRDVFILVGAAAINIVTGFRSFRPSLLGKINTVVQIVSVVLILIAAGIPSYISGYYLPTVYVTVFMLAVLSGIHYVFFASRLLNEERQQSEGNNVLRKPKHEQKKSSEQRVSAESRRRYFVALLFASIFIASTTTLLVIYKNVITGGGNRVPLSSDVTIWVTIFTAIVSAIGTFSTIILAWRNDKRDAREKELKIAQLQRELAASSEKPGLPVSEETRK